MAELAGEVGRIVNFYASLLFGWDAFFIPIVLLLVAAVSLYPDKR
ncbi:MAG: hypothetical protein UY82_C0021G0010 [Candidatus Uhrbacteria bacterium GW2011_GWC2_53_7]|uniref:Uncharacterized protein n=1 Tax=Candidatus Uhrbacteria bacterium GW2011_GWC2_53_7 TaxID=1618986 RepID=A0A0G2A6L3_9BACT|nr:MAG: hypothetical protein UY82_C0021G0010 [Candidatus Uhrbacteria bacterium GW2011_GWC2_53_7]